MSDSFIIAVVSGCISLAASVASSTIAGHMTSGRWMHQVEKELSIENLLNSSVDNPRERLVVQMLHQDIFEKTMKGLGYEWVDGVPRSRKAHFREVVNLIVLTTFDTALYYAICHFLGISAVRNFVLVVLLNIIILTATLRLLSCWPKNKFNYFYKRAEEQKHFDRLMKKSFEALEEGELYRSSSRVCKPAGCEGCEAVNPTREGQ